MIAPVEVEGWHEWRSIVRRRYLDNAWPWGNGSQVVGDECAGWAVDPHTMDRKMDAFFNALEVSE